MADFNNLKVGDVLVCHWGGTTKQFDFFQVVGKTTSSVKIRALDKNAVQHSDNFLQYDVTPIKDKFMSEVLLRRPSKEGYIKGAHFLQHMHLSNKYNKNKTYTEDYTIIKEYLKYDFTCIFEN